MSAEHGFVRVTCARDLFEAEFFRTLLLGSDIPAIIEDENSEVLGMPQSIVDSGVPVLVPADRQAEAERILADRSTPSESDQTELEREALAAIPEDVLPPEDPDR